MNIIAVTDIFGKTVALENLLKELSGYYESIEIVDPYENKTHHFKNENDAYRYFQKEVGLEKYIELLYTKLQHRESSSQILIGFSVGASAVWVVSNRLESFSNTKGFCFYSSQVKNYLEVSPKIEIDFYFSKSEPAYDVSEMHARLSRKSNVTCYKTSYLHGFMNRYSQNFNETGYYNYLKKLKENN